MPRARQLGAGTPWLPSLSPACREAAAYLLQRLDKGHFKGVCYFDAVARQWTILDMRGRRLPRGVSPVAERDTFTIYDDARCRGADLQLRRDAVGLLTLGPRLCKDKLMQSAGRLRQLGRGQGLRFVGTADVADKIRSACGLRAPTVSSSPCLSSPPPVSMPLLSRLLFPFRCVGWQPGSSPTGPADVPAPCAEAVTSRHVLQWVMDNTVHATEEGIIEWARQGLHYAATKDAPHRALQVGDALAHNTVHMHVPITYIRPAAAPASSLNGRLSCGLLGRRVRPCNDQVSMSPVAPCSGQSSDWTCGSQRLFSLATRHGSLKLHGGPHSLQMKCT